MATNVIITMMIFCQCITVIGAKGLQGKHGKQTGRKSNTVTVKYEGTLDEAKAFGSSLGLEFQSNVFGEWYVFTVPTLPQTQFLVPKDVPDININIRKAKKLDRKVKFIEQESYRKRIKRSLVINDEKWPDQWHLQPAQTPSMNVYKAWEMGYTGSGVTVAIVDDGMDVDHPDLIQNYNPSLSYDFITNTADPSHKDSGDGHGTNCAGVVAAVKDTTCVIGVAYESRLAAIRNLGDGDGDGVASIEATALTHKYQYIDIYSNSWGPEDDGVTMEPLDKMVEDAFEFTIKEGRNAKGTIYTFASGNGGYMDDSCSADPYSGSMYTISISAVDQNAASASYSERCTSILAATYSGDVGLLDITTTGPNQTCVDDFDGTSAACPQASGIIALTLQANPDLTWRDIQHMIVEFSNHSGLQHRTGDYDFYTNGAGKQVSLWTGFGLMDAKAMVDNASTWLSVPPRIACGSDDLFIHRSQTIQFTERYNVTNCFIKHLEHVQIRISYLSSFRGRVEFYLRSPMGTESLIVPQRANDDFSHFTTFTFMSVHTWGEDPNGQWQLTMNPVSQKIDMYLFAWRLELFGTATNPLEGTPSVGTFGSPCADTESCTSVVDGGCLKDNTALCDDICVPCKNGFHFRGGFCEKDCPPLAFVDGGYLVLTYTQEGIIAKYSCDDGYAFIGGDLTRLCGSDGVWTGTEPICDIDCGPLVAPVNGSVSYNGTTYDFSAVYACNEGFSINDGDEERICSEYGEWTGSEPICRRGCRTLENPENGNVSFTNTTEGSEAVYTCEEGYILSGGKSQRICSPKGKWSSVEPACLIDKVSSSAVIAENQMDLLIKLYVAVLCVVFLMH
ncbi:neuroendocrine convertase 2-like [Mercenaria mercenaria]|uniref:neuroendocrine convertase 2-like n=1 Tax=Mercenaria mercenaria TaxID=6596 RepID=UPI00234F4958|nr:neuroendocrine convertase 2-like [Mercenaria mercenaria]XP_053375878.1 neuroendocrine convertase 2-like [Mercenaria mercenaria]